MARRLLPRAVVFSLSVILIVLGLTIAGCETAPSAEVTCGLHGCFDVGEHGPDGWREAEHDKSDGSTERVSYRSGFVVVGMREASASMVMDLDALASTEVGAAVLDEVDAQAAALGGRIVLRPRPDPEGEELSCANTVFSAGGFDLRRAQVTEYELDEDGRVVALSPGDEVLPSSIRVLYNRECLARYDDGSPCAPPFVFLMHELIHVRNAMTGQITSQVHDPSDPMPGGSNHEEARTIGRGAYQDEPISENALRRELGLPIRHTHATLCGRRE